MPKYRIGGSYGYAGTDWEDEIEAEDEDDAEEQAKDRAMEQVEWWVKAAVPKSESEEE